jgi:hypothetical protein
LQSFQPFLVTSLLRWNQNFPQLESPTLETGKNNILNKTCWMLLPDEILKYNILSHVAALDTA